MNSMMHLLWCDCILTQHLYPAACFFLQHTLSFQLPPAAAGAHVAALFRLTEAAAGGAGGGSSSSSGAGAGAAGPPGQWAKQVFSAAHEQLRR
jgi:hypothetical protein